MEYCQRLTLSQYILKPTFLQVYSSLWEPQPCLPLHACPTVWEPLPNALIPQVKNSWCSWFIVVSTFQYHMQVRLYPGCHIRFGHLSDAFP